MRRSSEGARVLAVRSDSDGDVLMTGPAITALSLGADGVPAARVDVLASRGGAAAARLLPDVDQVLVADVPWAGYRPPAPDPDDLAALVETVRAGSYDEVVVFTGFHQSPLPTALVARLAGVGRVSGASEDYPGTLLDVRYRRPGTPEGSGGDHEVIANLALVAATGRAVPQRDRVRLAVRDDLPDLPADVAAALGDLATDGRYVVVHPGASVPARAPDPGVASATVAAMVDAGWPVVVTGGPAEKHLAAAVAAGTPALDLAGRTDLAGLARVLAGAAAVVVGNTGPAHLAAAVGTPVACWFSAVMPPERWSPFGVATVLLGDPGAACRMSRVQVCPVPGHPCLDVAPAAVVAAVADLAAGRVGALPALPATAAPAGVRTTASDGTGTGPGAAL